MVSINLTTRGAVDILDPLEGLARRHAGCGEDHVVGPDQVVQGELALRVVKPILDELLHLRALRRPHPGLHLPAEALHDRRGQDTLRRPADADDGVQLGPAQADRDGGGEVSLGPDVDARSSLPDLLDEVLVPVPVQNGDGYLRGPAPHRLCYDPYVLRDGCVDVDLAPGLPTGDQLAHVHVGSPEHGSLRGGRDRRDRPLLALDQKLETLDGLDREINLRPARAQSVPDAQDTGSRLERAYPPPLVRALFAQDRHRPRRGDLLELPSEGLRGQRVGLLVGPGHLEPRYLERDPLRYGGVLHGYRGCGRARIGHANEPSNLPVPDTTQASCGLGLTSKRCEAAPPLGDGS